MSFQNPPLFNSISFVAILYHILNNLNISISYNAFIDKLKAIALSLSIDFKLLESDNIYFSGGELKKLEIIQMYFLKPKLCLLDEIDTQLDISSKKILSKMIQDYVCTYIIVTHDIYFSNMLNIDNSIKI